MERKIGEIFEYNGEWYQCVKGGDCNCCDLLENGICVNNFSLAGSCFSHQREDKTCVLFKKLEKVGEQFLYKGKQMQSYIRATDELICNWNNNLLLLEHGDSDIIDIEIKQNKEDMEEKKVKLDQLVTDYTSNKITYNEFEKAVKELYADKEESKPSLKPFSLEEAKAGKPVCTRDGRKARIICFDRKDVRPIVALIKSDNGDEGVYYYYADGLNLDKYSSVFDLMMLPEKKEGWVNVYRDCDGVNITKDDNIYSSKDAAISSAQIIDRDNYVATTIIKWEDSYDSSNNDTNNIHNCMFYLQY